MLELTRDYAAILFDMDGTLLDSSLVVNRIMGAWADAQGLNVDEVLKRSHGRRSFDNVRAFAKPGMDCEREAAEIDAQEEADVEGIVPIPGVADFLDQIPDGKWAVVTSATRELATRRITAAGLPLPEILVTSEDVQEGKPAPDGYLLGARMLGLEAGQCLVFEDALAGLQAGQSAGCDVVAIRCANPHPIDIDCDQINDYREISVKLDGQLISGAV